MSELQDPIFYVTLLETSILHFTLFSRDAGTGMHEGALRPLPFGRGGDGGTSALT